jgi:mannose-1-phosphate guanylyltransferase
MPKKSRKKSQTSQKLASDPSVYGVVLAGGSGTRFWPKSRLKNPKQLCSLGGQDKAMLDVTLSRFVPLVAPARRMIVTHKDQLAATRKIAGAKCPVLIPEPQAKNTAPAIALAALAIERMAEDGSDPVMISMHADHVITDLNEFNAVMARAVTIARNGWLTLLGVVPSFPETGYGYIERGQALHLQPFSDTASAYEVAGFREKPDYETAKRYVDSGRFLWNSGLFVFPVKPLLAELDRSLPKDMKALRSCLKKSVPAGKNPFDQAKLEKVYPRLTKISIDEAVLEKSQKIAVVDADFGWQDVGTWDALAKAFPATDHAGNLVYGQAVTIDTTNTIIDTDGPLVATIGLQDMVVVHHKGAILVCPKSRAQDVKKIVEILEKAKHRELL